MKHEFDTYQQASIGYHPSALFIDDTVHVFGGKNSKSHHILTSSSDNPEPQAIAVIDESWISSNTCNASVYVKSQNCIYVFGGYDELSDIKRLDGIWRYDLRETNKGWKKMNGVLPYKMESFGSVLTNDERYIILFGGAVGDKNVWNDEIFLWNLESMVISKSDIKCPQQGLYTAVIMPNNEIFVQRVFDKCCQWKIKVGDLVKDDKLIVDGYLRSLAGMDLPKEICGMIYYHYIRITNIA